MPPTTFYWKQKQPLIGAVIFQLAIFVVRGEFGRDCFNFSSPCCSRLDVLQPLSSLGSS